MGLNLAASSVLSVPSNSPIILYLHKLITAELSRHRHRYKGFNH